MQNENYFHWTYVLTLIYSYLCSWRAFRVQKIPSVREPDPVPNNKRQDNFWSFGDDESGDDIDLEELSRALSEAASLVSTGKEKNSKKSVPRDLPAKSYDTKEPGKPLIL